MRRIFTPCIVVISGAPLHGKSTVGTQLAAESNLRMIDVDYITWPNGDKMEAELRYQHIIAQARSVLKKGEPVLLVGTFSKTIFKEPLRALMRDFKNVQRHIFRMCVTDRDCIRERLAIRDETGHPSTIRTEAKYELALRLAESWAEDECVININTEDDIEKTKRDILGHLCRVDR